MSRTRTIVALLEGLEAGRDRLAARPLPTGFAFVPFYFSWAGPAALEAAVRPRRLSPADAPPLWGLN